MRKFTLAVMTAGMLLCGLAWRRLTLAAPVASGNARHSGQHEHGARLQKLAQYLGLTADQKSQIKAIWKSAGPQAKTIKENASLSPTDKTAQLKALHQSTRAQIMGVLTPEQKQKLAQLRHHGKDQDANG